MTKTSQKLHDLAEFNWIQELSSLSGADYGSKSSVPGDDAALLSLNESSMLIAKDMLIEGTHFRTDWSTARDWIRKAFVANVSDIEAMGGEAHTVLCGISFSKTWSNSYKKEIASSIALCLKEFGLKLVGGDTTSSSIGVISLTLMGSPSKRVLTRANLKSGDELWVQGELGASHLGLEVLSEKSLENLSIAEKELVKEHVNPEVKFGLGSFLSQNEYSNSAMDMSDGLGQSVFHLAEASRVKIVIEENLIPVSSMLNNSDQVPKLTSLTQAALWGGEEYKLIFGLSQASELPKEAIDKWKLRKVGFVEKGEGCYLKRSNCEQIALNLNGFSHF